jgi:hypothetical protein
MTRVGNVREVHWHYTATDFQMSEAGTFYTYAFTWCDCDFGASLFLIPSLSTTSWSSESGRGDDGSPLSADAHTVTFTAEEKTQYTRQRESPSRGVFDDR